MELVGVDGRNIKQIGYALTGCGTGSGVDSCKWGNVIPGSTKCAEGKIPVGCHDNLQRKPHKYDAPPPSYFSHMNAVTAYAEKY
jgi:hypothetical protein